MRTVERFSPAAALLGAALVCSIGWASARERLAFSLESVTIDRSLAGPGQEPESVSLALELANPAQQVDRLIVLSDAWFAAVVGLGGLGLLLGVVALVPQRTPAGVRTYRSGTGQFVARCFIGSILAFCVAWAFVEASTRHPRSAPAWAGAVGLALFGLWVLLWRRSVAIDPSCKQVVVRWGEPVTLARRRLALAQFAGVQLDAIYHSRSRSWRFRLWLSGERRRLLLARNLSEKRAHAEARELGAATGLTVLDLASNA